MSVKASLVMAAIAVVVWWQEKDTSIVTQVVDFGRGRVHTTWTSPDKKLAAYQGTIVPQGTR
jgi:hypothetical protein